MTWKIMLESATETSVLEGSTEYLVPQGGYSYYSLFDGLTLGSLYAMGVKLERFSGSFLSRLIFENDKSGYHELKDKFIPQTLIPLRYNNGASIPSIRAAVSEHQLSDTELSEISTRARTDAGHHFKDADPQPDPEETEQWVVRREQDLIRIKLKDFGPKAPFERRIAFWQHTSYAIPPSVDWILNPPSSDTCMTIDFPSAKWNLRPGVHALYAAPRTGKSKMAATLATLFKNKALLLRSGERETPSFQHSSSLLGAIGIALNSDKDVIIIDSLREELFGQNSAALSTGLSADIFYTMSAWNAVAVAHNKVIVAIFTPFLTGDEYKDQNQENLIMNGLSASCQSVIRLTKGSDFPSIDIIERDFWTYETSGGVNHLITPHVIQATPPPSQLNPYDTLTGQDVTIPKGE